MKLDPATHIALLPTSIAKAFAEVMKDIEPAKRTAEAKNEDGTTSTYSGVDDVYAVLRNAMAKKGLICEMMSGGADVNSIFEIGGGRVGFWLKLIPCWTLVVQGSELTPDTEAAAHGAEDASTKSEMTERYYNEAGEIDIIVDLSGGSQAMLAARTNGQRTYLKNLFLLNSAPGAQAAEGEKTEPQARADPDEASPISVSPRVPRKPANSIMFNANDSAALSATMIEEIYACKTLAECDAWFKHRSREYARLKAVDQPVVKDALETRKNALGPAAA